MDNENVLLNIIIRHYPDILAVYLFGSHGTAYETDDSDVDIALLLPHHSARTLLRWPNPCVHELEQSLERVVDMVDLRAVDTVFQVEIIRSGRLIYCTNQNAVDEFEMYALSFYQQLNRERADILRQIGTTGRVLAV